MVKDPAFLGDSGEFSSSEEKEEDINKVEFEIEYINVIKEKQDILPYVARFSKWLTMMRSTSWTDEFLHKLRNSVTKIKGELTIDEIIGAENVWWTKITLAVITGN